MFARLADLLRAFALIMLLSLVAACGAPSQPENATAGKGPVVLAAASLQEALTEVAGAWAAQGHPAPVLSFAGSSALARQVEQGAPADLFVSADEEWMDVLDRQGLVRPGTRADLLSNRIVLIAPADGTAKSLADLGDGRLALADPDAVPAGKYAKAALEHLGQWAAVSGRIAPAENVRAALALVERGEAPLGIVYATDARASGKVRLVETLPEDSHPPIRYPVAILSASTHPDAAALRAFLASPEAMRIFASHGFGTVE
ncbi:MAG TPA: molybdate ABC transporter substrate-binding protein [Croceibacterium sp.]|nr:molybdate ABC transporter substrate-binding protein [Croceibacterium sp.]